MKNKVETFDSFNNGVKRPDRKRHMELCGFQLCGSALIPADSGFKKPKDAGIRYAQALNEKNNEEAHVVYFQSSKNMDGVRGYDYWINKLENRHKKGV